MHREGSHGIGCGIGSEAALRRRWVHGTVGRADPHRWGNPFPSNSTDHFFLAALVLAGALVLASAGALVLVGALAGAFVLADAFALAGAWARSEAATDFSAGLDAGLLRILDALVATFG